MKEFISKSIVDTQSIAKKWLSDIKKEPKNGASIIGLSGHLGAGKTAFVKEVAKELGVDAEVTSPTFVIMKIYKTKDQTFKTLVHIDAYRLSSKEELKVLNLDQFTHDPSILIMIEWPENVGMDAHLKFEAKEQGSIGVQCLHA